MAEREAAPRIPPVRIIAGGGGQAARPTTDRVRQALFDMLWHAPWSPYATNRAAIEGQRVLDAFAGTGALGLEALSRGAARALFVDDGAPARALLRENVEKLGLGGVTRIFRRDAAKLGQAPVGERFSLAFLDPPYCKNLAAPALRALHEGSWLSRNAVVVIEDAAAAPLDLPDAFSREDARKYGDTQLIIARYRG